MTDEIDPELETEVREECSNFGKVISVISATGFDGGIRIFVEFDTHKGLYLLNHENAIFTLPFQKPKRLRRN